LLGPNPASTLGVNKKYLCGPVVSWCTKFSNESVLLTALHPQSRTPSAGLKVGAGPRALPGKMKYTTLVVGLGQEPGTWDLTSSSLRGRRVKSCISSPRRWMPHGGCRDTFPLTDAAFITQHGVTR